jgi:hypothetical protein
MEPLTLCSNSAAQTLVDGSRADLISNQETVRIAHAYRIQYHLNDETLKEVQTYFKHQYVCIDPDSKSLKFSNHPVLHILNDYANFRIASAIALNKKDRLSTIELGATLKKNNVADHTCLLISDPREKSRYLASTSNATDVYRTDIFNFCRTGVSSPIICVDGAQNCSFRADVMYSTNAIYDISFDDFGEIFARHDISHSFNWLYLPISLIDRELSALNRNYRIRFDDENGDVHFSPNDLSFTYCHKFDAWYKWYTHTRIRCPGFDIVLEIIESYGDFHLMRADRVFSCVADQRLFRTFPIADLASDYCCVPNFAFLFRNLNYAKRKHLPNITVNRRAVELCLGYASRQVDGAYNFTAFSTVLSGQRHQIRIGKQIVQTAVDMKQDTFEDLAISLFIHGAVARFQRTRTVAAAFSFIKQYGADTFLDHLSLLFKGTAYTIKEKFTNLIIKNRKGTSDNPIPFDENARNIVNMPIRYFEDVEFSLIAHVKKVTPYVEVLRTPRVLMKTKPISVDITPEQTPDLPSWVHRGKNGELLNAIDMPMSEYDIQGMHNSMSKDKNTKAAVDPNAMPHGGNPFDFSNVDKIIDPRISSDKPLLQKYTCNQSQLIFADGKTLRRERHDILYKRYKGDHFYNDVYLLLCRYEIDFKTYGSYAAGAKQNCQLNDDVVNDTAVKHLHATPEEALSIVELFASPLNFRYFDYCSKFEEDKIFGAIGTCEEVIESADDSFTDRIFYANPPFKNMSQYVALFSKIKNDCILIAPIDECKNFKNFEFLKRVPNNSYIDGRSFIASTFGRCNLNTETHILTNFNASIKRVTFDSSVASVDTSHSDTSSVVSESETLSYEYQSDDTLSSDDSSVIDYTKDFALLRSVLREPVVRTGHCIITSIGTGLIRHCRIDSLEELITDLVKDYFEHTDIYQTYNVTAQMLYDYFVNGDYYNDYATMLVHNICRLYNVGVDVGGPRTASVNPGVQERIAVTLDNEHFTYVGGVRKRFAIYPIQLRTIDESDESEYDTVAVDPVSGYAVTRPELLDDIDDTIIPSGFKRSSALHQEFHQYNTVVNTEYKDFDATKPFVDSFVAHPSENVPQNVPTEIVVEPLIAEILPILKREDQPSIDDRVVRTDVPKVYPTDRIITERVSKKYDDILREFGVNRNLPVVDVSAAPGWIVRKLRGEKFDVHACVFEGAKALECLNDLVVDQYFDSFDHLMLPHRFPQVICDAACEFSEPIVECFVRNLHRFTQVGGNVIIKHFNTQPDEFKNLSRRFRLVVNYRCPFTYDKSVEHYWICRDYLGESMTFDIIKSDISVFTKSCANSSIPIVLKLSTRKIPECRIECNYMFGIPGSNKSKFHTLEYPKALFIVPTNKLKEQYLQHQVRNVSTMHIALFDTTKYENVIIDEAQAYPLGYFAAVRAQFPKARITLLGDADQINAINYDDDRIFRRLKDVGMSNNVFVTTRIPQDVVKAINSNYRRNYYSTSSVLKSVFISQDRPENMPSFRFNKGNLPTIHEMIGTTVPKISFEIDDQAIAAGLFDRPEHMTVALSRHLNQLVVYGNTDKLEKFFKIGGTVIDTYSELNKVRLYDDQRITSDVELQLKAVVDPPNIERLGANQSHIVDIFDRCLPKVNSNFANVSSYQNTDMPDIEQGRAQVNLYTLQPKDDNVSGFKIPGFEEFAAARSQFSNSARVSAHTMFARSGRKTPVMSEKKAKKIAEHFFASTAKFIFRDEKYPQKVLKEKLRCRPGELEENLGEYIVKLQSKIVGNTETDKVNLAELQKEFNNVHQTVKFFSKKQVKFDPSREFSTKAKAGQGVSAWTKSANLFFCSITRLLHKKIHALLRDREATPIIIPTNEPDEQFSEHVAYLMSAMLGKKTDFVMCCNDYTEWDAHNLLALILLDCIYFEAMGIVEDIIGTYRIFRETWDLEYNYGDFGTKLQGLLKQHSGQPNTLNGNTLGNLGVSTSCLDFTDVQFAMFKGDDMVVCAKSMKFSEFGKKNLKEMDFQLKLSEGDIGEFAGHILTPMGLFPDIFRRVAKFCTKLYTSEAIFEEAKMSVAQDLSCIKNQLALEYGVQYLSKHYEELGVTPTDIRILHSFCDRIKEMKFGAMSKKTLHTEYYTL